MSRLRIGILFGGRSEEHPISLKSVREVAKQLDPGTYEPFFVGITREGSWTLCDGPEFSDGSVASRPVQLSTNPGDSGLLVLDDGHYRLIELDVVFPVLHGRFGEDGSIQGLLELSGIPYVGCDIQSSALCMDKSLAYAVARDAGVATPDFRVLTGNETVEPEGLAYPVFVKPARSGSSFGVSKVASSEELHAAIEIARQFDSKILIEQAVVGGEVGCAILGEYPDLVVGEVDRIALTGGFFRIHQESQPETTSENSTPIVPADISKESRQRVQETAVSIYRALGCTGIARVDMFLTEDGSVLLNEVNTMPGMTSYSRYPRMMAAAGLPLSEVIDRVVASALARTTR